ncbi:hypothetical protein BN1110_01794 [bacterium YEK0313]|nr:hypothetical protein BN1110_01794 [bacterium YEK0313]
MTGRGRRKLTPEDRALWSHVVRDVTPLDPARAADLVATEEAPPEPEAKPVRRPEGGRSRAAVAAGTAAARADREAAAPAALTRPDAG